MPTITPDQERLIAAKLAGMTIPSGLGDHENACSIAAINLALSGELTDKIPPCMSEVIGRWIIGVQDSMPDDIRNSNQWKALLPLAAGTGRAHESERLKIVIDWMWDTVLASIQSIADSGGFGDQWREMTATSTDAACAAAARAAARAAAAAGAAVWTQFNPCGLLQRLIEA